MEPYDIWPAYVERVLSFVDVDGDPAAEGRDRRCQRHGRRHAAAGPRAAADRRASRYFFEPDGTFPNHEPNPLLPENREFIVAKTLEEGADLGVAFDGDADRCFFVDDTGEFVPGDFITALLAESILEKEPGREDHLRRPRQLGGARHDRARGRCRSINRVGHAFIKHRMREEGAVFGGEVSGHYYFRDFTQADSGVVPFLLMLELVSKRGKKLSELLAPVPGALLHHRRAQHARRRRRARSCRSSRSASAPRGRSATSTACRSTPPTGTSTSGRRTPSRCCGSTSRRCSQELMERKRDEVLAVIRE